jgi:hypothetical protein
VLVVVIVEAVSTSETFQSVYLRLHGLFIPEGRAMAQAVSQRPLTTEAQVRACVNPCGIYGGQSGTRQFFSEFFGFRLSISFHPGCPLMYIMWVIEQ